MALLGVRGLLAAHAIVADVLLLYGGLDRLSLPQWLEVCRPSAEAGWLFLSFCCITLGYEELLTVSAGWLGPAVITTSPPVDTAFAPMDAVSVASASSFASLATINFIACLLSTSADRRRLSALGMAIAAMACVAYWSLADGVGVLSTYGRPFSPLRYVLWAHTTPGLALISGSSHSASEAGRRLHRNIVSIMMTGFLATAAVPEPVARLGVAALWAWRIGWLGASFAYMFLSLRRVCANILRQATHPLTGQLISTLTALSWSFFPALWLASQTDLLSQPAELTLLALADFCAKMLSSVSLLLHAAESHSQLERLQLSQRLEREQIRADALRTFARTMGHDLRTPLQALVLSCHMANAQATALVSHAGTSEESAAESRAQSLLEHVQIAQSCTHMLSLVVSNMWELDQAGEGKQQAGGGNEALLMPSFAEEEVDLVSEIERTVGLLLASPTAKAEVKLKSCFDPRLPHVRVDASRLMRALLNLLTNAIKFTTSGSVTISVKLLSEPPPVGGLCEAHFEVADTGRGMEAEELQRATHPYSRSSTAEGGGMGLGLAIAAKAVAELGGKLELRSEGLGCGTSCSFSVRMQRGGSTCSGSRGSSESLEVSPPAAGRRLRVMLVDDSELLLKSVSEVIAYFGHTISHTAADGEAALQLLRAHSHEIDVAFVDINMPLMRGDEAIRRYREWERGHARPRLRAYAMSGDTNAAMTKQLRVDGFDGILAKPVYPLAFSRICEEVFAALPAAGAAPPPASPPRVVPATLSEAPRGVPATLSEAVGRGAAARAPATGLAAAPAAPAAGSSTLASGSASVSASGAASGAACETEAEMLAALPDSVFNARDFVAVIGIPKDTAAALVVQMDLSLGRGMESMVEAEGAPWDEAGTQSVLGIAHTAKGNALQVCASRLAAASETLEILAAGGKSERASAALAVWRKTAEEFRHFVRCNPTLEDLFE